MPIAGMSVGACPVLVQSKRGFLVDPLVFNPLEVFVCCKCPPPGLQAARLSEKVMKPISVAIED